MTLPALLRKAAGDAGFDLPLGSDGEWQRMGLSGTPHVVWIVPSGAGALLAVTHPAVLQEFGQATWTEVPLPREAAGAVRCRSAEELLGTLRRTLMLLENLPPAPEHELALRLEEVGGTEAEALVKQRVGQDLYREMLMKYWNGRCAVTGLAVPALLRASHAKPWKDSDDRERLDVYNGVLLAVHLDALFDQGFVAVAPDGSLLRSPQLPTEASDLLVPGLENLRVARLTDMHQPYLAYHRTHVFRAAADSPELSARYAIQIIARIPMAVVRSSHEARQRFASAMQEALVSTGTTIQAVRSAVTGAPDPLDEPGEMVFDDESAAYPVVMEAAIPLEVLSRPSDARDAFCSEICRALGQVGVDVGQIYSASGLAPDPLLMPDYGAC